MKIKKFKAKTFSEALTLVKREFTEDAVILSTEEKRGIRPFVEITAAIDYDMGRQKKDTVDKVKRKRRKDAGQKTGAKRISRKSSTLPVVCSPALSTDFVPKESEYPEVTKHKFCDHSTTGTKVKNNGSETESFRNRQMILHFLRERSVREEFAFRLCDKAKSLNDIPSLISADIRVKGGGMFREFFQSPSDSGGHRKAVMLIGPTGVGKTTTLAKLSALAMSDGKRVGIISLDTYRIGAVEQIRIYANIMGIPLLIASTLHDLRSSLPVFAQNRDIIFIDTSGRNPKDEMYINTLFEITQIRFPIELHLLMSANCDDECMMEAYRFYRRLPIDYISFTKVDEAVRFGSLYNLLLLYQKPAAYITTGQKVPDDIEFVTSDRLVNLILEKG
jgi:flagellar biosynthesis protein FlhF